MVTMHFDSPDGNGGGTIVVPTQRALVERMLHTADRSEPAEHAEWLRSLKDKIDGAIAGLEGPDVGDDVFTLVPVP